MLRQPKYNKGDKVFITVQGKEYEGEIYIIDENGTWDDPSDVSYDVMIDGWCHPAHPDQPGRCLVKHCTESMVKPFSNVKHN